MALGQPRAGARENGPCAVGRGRNLLGRRTELGQGKTGWLLGCRGLGRCGRKGKGVAGWAKKEERVGRAGLLWVLDSFSNFFCISKSNPNSDSRQMNSNLNLNSHKHSTNKKMLQHDATTKIKPMINFNYL